MYYPNPAETLRKQEEFRKRIENQRKYGVTSYKNYTTENKIQTKSSATTYKITKDLTHLHAQVRGTGRCVREKVGNKIETTKTISEEIQKLFVKYRMTSQEKAEKSEDITDNRVSIVLEINVNRSNFEKITQKELTVDETKMIKKTKSSKSKNIRKKKPSDKEEMFDEIKSLKNKVILKIIPDKTEIKNEAIKKMKIIGKIQAIKSKRFSEIFSENTDEPIEALVLEFVNEEDKKELDNNNICAVQNGIPAITTDEVDTTPALPVKTLASRAVSYIGEVLQKSSIQHYSVTAVVCGGMLIGAYHADDVLNFLKTSGLAYGANDEDQDSGLWGLVPKF